MHPWTRQISPDEGKEYLAHLQCLAVELETAMHRIARQELVPLQESIKMQQSACSKLAHMQRDRSAELVGDHHPGRRGVDSDMALQIDEAIAAVVSLNRRYAALLKHSGETLRLFAGLFRSYQSAAQPASGIQAHLQTWSCEV